MTEKYAHDPVTALSEADATGRTAEIFADIREVMHIPILTSIWRILAGIDGGLESAWQVVRSIMSSGAADAALCDLKTTARFPAPDPLTAERLDDFAVTSGDISSALIVVEAYTRSNSLNLLALLNLVAERTRRSTPESPEFTASTEPKWPTSSELPELPKLNDKSEIDPDTWDLLERIKYIGSQTDTPVIATLWRHLAEWPGLLSLIIESWEPLQTDGSLHRSIEENYEVATRIAGELPSPATETRNIPPDAMNLIKSYVGDPAAVNHMVVIGHGLRSWLRSTR